MLKLPTHVQLEITDTCNLRCKHCYHFDTDKMPKTSDLTNKKTMRLVQKLIDAKIYSLVITGGEPLARPEITINTVKIAKKAGMFVSINTNLLLITPDIITQLKKLNIDSLLVSCPASDPYVYKKITRCGNYNRLRSKLKLLIDAGIPCMVNMVVTLINNQYIRSTATDMSKLGVKRFAATPVSLNVEHPGYNELLDRQQTIALLEDLKWCADNLGLEVDILEPLPKCFFPNWCWGKNYAFTKRVCQAGRMSVSISNTGNVRSCSHNPIVYGNLFEKTLENIWGKINVHQNSATPIICKNCPTVSSCNGACRTNSLAKTGLLNEPDRFTVGHINLPFKKQTEVTINNNSVVHFKGNLRWRKESENYSISSKTNGGNLIIVNEEMFRFVSWLEKSLPLPIKQLSKDSTSEAFTKIIRSLIKKEFIFIT